MIENETEKKNVCRLTGIEYASESEQPIKKMCFNCVSLIYDNGVAYCANENVKQIGINKIKENLPEGFEIESIELKPMLLKNPCKNCKNYKFDSEGMANYLKIILDSSYSNEKLGNE